MCSSASKAAPRTPFAHMRHGRGIPISHTTFSWISPHHQTPPSHTSYSWTGLSSREIHMLTAMDPVDDAMDEIAASVGRVVEESLQNVRRGDDPALFATVAATTFVAGCVGAEARDAAASLLSRTPPPAV